MATNTKRKLTKADDDFTPAEVIKYERYFKESIDKLKQDDGTPKTERVAYLGYLKHLREFEGDLGFVEYFESLESFDELNSDAFGKKDEEGKAGSESAKSE